MKTLRCILLILIVFLTSCNGKQNTVSSTVTPTTTVTSVSTVITTPTTAILPPTATFTPSATLPSSMAEWLIPIDGHAFRVLYDETVWLQKSFDGSEDELFSYKGTGLAHRTIPACAILGIQGGIEPPKGWRVESKDTQIGEIYGLEEFYDPNGQLSFVVYGIAYRLIFHTEPQKCRQDAEQVLTTFKPVIMPTPIATPTLAPGMTEWLIPFRSGEAFRLVYDKTLWIMREFEDTEIEYLPATGPGLSHRFIPKCSILLNMGTEVPQGWTIEIKDIILGEHRFSKREFYGEAGQLPLAIYDSDFRVDFPIESEKCLYDAEQVLATYHVVNIP